MSEGIGGTTGITKSFSSALHSLSSLQVTAIRHRQPLSSNRSQGSSKTSTNTNTNTNTSTPPYSTSQHVFASGDTTDTADVQGLEQQELPIAPPGQIHPTAADLTGYLAHYCANLAKSLTEDNLEQTLEELKHIRQSSNQTATPAAQTQTRAQGRQAQVHFLAQLLSEFISHIQTTENGYGYGFSYSFSDSKASALETLLVQHLSHQPDFATVICSALYIATHQHEQKTPIGRNVTLSSLVQYLSKPQKQKQSSGKNPLSNLGIITFTTAICSGWQSSPSDSNQVIDLATRILLSSLEKQEFDSLTPALSQSILFAFLSSEAYQDVHSPTRKIVEALSKSSPISNIIKNATDSNTNSKTITITNMAERLSPASAGFITNLLADLGPACTQHTITLRDTLRIITKSLPPNDNNNTQSSSVDEQVMARLLYFFSERKSRNEDKGRMRNGSVGSSTSVGNLTNDFDISDTNEWDLANVATVISEDYKQLNWDLVALNFDFNDFLIHDTRHLVALLNLYKTGAKKSFPLTAIVTRWSNKSGQLSFLENAFALTPAEFQFPLDEDEKEDAATAGDLAGASCQNAAGWACARVLQLMLELSDDQSVAKRVRELFIKGLLSCPEVLLCALVRRLQASSGRQTAPGSNVGMQTKGELMRELVPLFFKPNVNALHRVRNGPAAIRRLWSFAPSTVVAACIEAWRSTANDTPQARLAVIVHVIKIIRLLPNPQSATATILGSNKDIEFNIALAFVMVDNEMLVLKRYLDDRIKSFGVPFVIAMVTYLGRNYQNALPRASTANNNNNGEGAPLLSKETMSMTLSCLRALDSSILNKIVTNPNPNGAEKSITIGESIKMLVNVCSPPVSSLGRVSAPSPSTVPTPDLSSMNQSSDDIEEMTNSYFQKIYTSEQSIDEIVEMLKRFKSSGNTRENEIFACMIHNLFDEYRFFSKYPEKELRITGILFGKLIQHQLVTSITLGIALRYVLEALRKPPGQGTTNNTSSGKMFRYGMFALEQFKERLHEWPQYCSHIVQIPHLKEGYAALVGEIEGAMCESQNKSASGGDSVGNATNDSASASSDKKSISDVPTTVNVQLPAEKPFVNDAHSIGKPFTEPVNPVRKEAVFGPGLGRAVTNMDEDVQHEAPAPKDLDGVTFIINNVTLSNVEQKANELKELLETKYFGWLGHYFVVKRISTQPNFHAVYLAFLEHLGEYGKGLIDAILSSVYMNVGKLLRSPKITTSTSERSLLKNLGSWLGQITLARNKPILQITLDCKELLYQGYETGMLIAVTPFVAKILEGSKNSVVFRPPNPWLMGLLSVFRSLYEVEDLKMNIKFEVEVLCKNLGVKLEDIPLREEDLAKRLLPEKSSSPDFNMKSSMANASAASAGQSTPGGADGKQGASNLASRVSAAAEAIQIGSPSPSTGGTSKDQQTVIPNLASYVTINASLVPMFQQIGTSGAAGNLDNATLKRSVPIAVEKAIREIIQPVVERSVTIACITTKEIVTKDFAMESDEKK